MRDLPLDAAALDSLWPRMSMEQFDSLVAQARAALELRAALAEERKHSDALASAAELFREHSGCGCCAGDRRYEALEALNALQAAHAARRAAEAANDPR